jgi:hypothetical protein
MRGILIVQAMLKMRMHYERRVLASILGLNADGEYYKPPTIDCFEAAVDRACDEFDAPSVSFDDGELASLSMDGIRSQVATWMVLLNQFCLRLQ